MLGVDDVDTARAFSGSAIRKIVSLARGIDPTNVEACESTWYGDRGDLLIGAYLVVRGRRCYRGQHQHAEKQHRDGKQIFLAFHRWVPPFFPTGGNMARSKHPNVPVVKNELVRGLPLKEVVAR